MFIITTVTIDQEDIKPAVASYNKLDKLTVNVKKIGPMVKIDENDNTLSVVTVYDMNSLSCDEDIIKEELSNRIERAKELIHSAVGRIEYYQNFEEFLIPLIGKKV
ncbi:MAG: hypothetical protein GY707_03330 [Desulfobacteraceae bacterium]|nr:hypothetical protein [Desulfobacteraceae bacterium]